MQETQSKNEENTSNSGVSVFLTKDSIKRLRKCFGPILKRWSQLLSTQEPNRNLQLRVVVQNALNTFEESPHYAETTRHQPQTGQMV
jgi:hypothetical protein